MKDDELSRDEQAALQAMKRDDLPPAQLEDAVVHALRRRGLIAPRRPWMLAIATAAAAAMVAFAAGLAVPRSAPLATSPSAPRFAILLYSGEISPDAPRRREEYAAWARQVATQGTAISGEELADDPSDPAGPRGFFIISAVDADAARAIAATCPHTKYGGRVVVRRIAERPGA